MDSKNSALVRRSAQELFGFQYNWYPGGRMQYVHM
jgi:hypothetical protein